MPSVLLCGCPEEYPRSSAHVRLQKEHGFDLLTKFYSREIFSTPHFRGTTNLDLLSVLNHEKQLHEHRDLLVRRHSVARGGDVHQLVRQSLHLLAAGESQITLGAFASHGIRGGKFNNGSALIDKNNDSVKKRIMIAFFIKIIRLNTPS